MFSIHAHAYSCTYRIFNLYDASNAILPHACDKPLQARQKVPRNFNLLCIYNLLPLWMHESYMQCPTPISVYGYVLTLSISRLFLSRTAFKCWWFCLIFHEQYTVMHCVCTCEYTCTFTCKVIVNSSVFARSLYICHFCIVPKWQIYNDLEKLTDVVSTYTTFRNESSRFTRTLTLKCRCIKVNWDLLSSDAGVPAYKNN
jgi:hypothetical protein